MIKNVIFDLSEVLLRGLYGTEKLISQRLEQKVRFSDLRIPELDKLFKGEISERRYWESLIARRRWDAEVSDLERCVRDNFREIRGTRSVIKALRKKKYRLGLLSVHAKEWVRYLNDRFGHHQLFDYIIYSYDNRILKPDPRAFRAMMGAMGGEPEECLFIDDMLPNVQSAAAIGMAAYQFTSAEALQAELPLFDLAL